MFLEIGNAAVDLVVCYAPHGSLERAAEKSRFLEVWFSYVLNGGESVSTIGLSYLLNEHLSCIWVFGDFL